MTAKRRQTLEERCQERVNRSNKILVYSVDHISAELRRVARQVRRLRDKGKKRTEYQSNREARCAVISAYTLAIDDVLDLLKEAAK